MSLSERQIGGSLEIAELAFERMTTSESRVSRSTRSGDEVSEIARKRTQVGLGEEVWE
jgi:hypothetical protein